MVTFVSQKTIQEKEVLHYENVKGSNGVLVPLPELQVANGGHHHHGVLSEVLLCLLRVCFSVCPFRYFKQRPKVVYFI